MNRSVGLRGLLTRSPTGPPSQFIPTTQPAATLSSNAPWSAVKRGMPVPGVAWNPAQKPQARRSTCVGSHSAISDAERYET